MHTRIKTKQPTDTTGIAKAAPGQQIARPAQSQRLERPDLHASGEHEQTPSPQLESNARPDKPLRPGHDFAQVGVRSEDLRPGDSGRSLPEPIRAKMERAFGADFSTVRIHQSPEADEIGALAYTSGEQISFAPDQYRPADLSGQRILGHELAHVVQQRSGRARPPRGGLLGTDSSLESEADTLGLKAASGEAVSVPNFTPGQQAASFPGSVVQAMPGRKGKDKKPEEDEIEMQELHTRDDTPRPGISIGPGPGPVAAQAQPPASSAPAQSPPALDLAQLHAERVARNRQRAAQSAPAVQPPAPVPSFNATLEQLHGERQARAAERAARPGPATGPGTPAPRAHLRPTPRRDRPNIHTLADLAGPSASSQGAAGSGGAIRNQAQAGTMTMLEQKPTPPPEVLRLRLRQPSPPPQVPTEEPASPAPPPGVTVPVMTPVTEHPLMPAAEEEASQPVPAQVSPDQQFLQARKRERQAELGQLVKGQKDTSYKGRGPAGDLRRVVQDPRLNYQLERESDRGNWAQRKLKRAKEVGKAKLHEAGVAIGVSEPKPGEDFDERYDRKDETGKEKAKRYGTKAADFAASYVPVLSSVKQVSTAYTEHQKKKVADELAADPSLSPVHQKMATGMSKAHKQQRDETLIDAAVGVASSVAPGPAGLVGKGIAKGATAAGKTIVKEVKDAIENRSSDPRARRLEATAPASSPAEVDQANQSLIQLQEEDPAFAQATVGHLMAPTYDVNREIALNRELQRAREQGSSDEGVSREPTLAPSMVYNQARKEDARMRLRQGFGSRFQKLEASERSTWITSLSEVAGSTIGAARSLARRSSGVPAPESIELEELDERERRRRSSE